MDSILSNVSSSNVARKIPVAIELLLGDFPARHVTVPSIFWEFIIVILKIPGFIIVMSHNKPIQFDVCLHYDHSPES